MPTQLDRRLTHSQIQCAKNCLRKHQLRYCYGLAKDEIDKPLRIGRAIHRAIHLKALNKTNHQAILSVMDDYEKIKPPSATEEYHKWEVERQVVARMLTGYFWRWQEMDDQMEIVESEQPFEIPIVNPASNRSSRTFAYAGIRDRVVILPDGKRRALQETKTTSDSLDVDSDFWKRLRIDSQISKYMLLDNVETVLYDALKKPTIKPTTLTQAATKHLIETGEYQFKFKGNDAVTKIGTYKIEVTEGIMIDDMRAERISHKNGIAIRETTQMFGDRLSADMGRRPDFYFARREIARLENDLDEIRFDLWQMAQIIRDCERYDRWPRNDRHCVGFGQCEYFGLCTGGYDPNSGEIPDGFIRLNNPHRELEEME